MDLKYTLEKYMSVDRFLGKKPNLEKLLRYISESADNFENFISVIESKIKETVGQEQYDTGYDDAVAGCEQHDVDIEEIKEESFQEGYDEGHDDGYEEGEEVGVRDGEEKGREVGYNEGHRKGFEAGLAEAARIAKLLQP